MKPLYLYLENFTCFRKSELDLSNITSALIVGRQDSNELESNGIGKTSIFRAIEYVLFAQTKHPVLGKDIMLERLIQDDATKVLVVFDFEIDSIVYRISRSRTRKGITDLCFYQRNAVPGNPHTPTTDKLLWNDLTCRRTADTDAEIAKLIRIGYKSFINTNHSMQLDVGGIATATPEKRRAILKDVFDLTPYAMLEKIAKKRAEDLFELIKQNKTILTSIGNPTTDIIDLQAKITATEQDIDNQTTLLAQQKEAQYTCNEAYIAWSAKLNAIETKATIVIKRQTTLTTELNNLRSSIINYTNKKNAIVSEANAIDTDLKSLKQSKDELIGIDFTNLSKLQDALDASADQIKTKNIELGLAKAELDKLNIPLPAGSTCDQCRTILTPEHKQECMRNIETDKVSKKELINGITNYIKAMRTEDANIRRAITQLQHQQERIYDLTTKLETKTKERADKKKLFEEYKALLIKFQSDLTIKETELEQVQADIVSSSASEITALQEQVAEHKKTLERISHNIDLTNKHISDFQSKKAVLLYSVEEKTKDIKHKQDLQDANIKLEEEYSTYPYTIQAFASIPDMIIENVLEGLQEETNKLLVQIRPELQLEFATEKTKTDGDQTDTLEINYFLNNKPKDYSQLSGAQQLCVMFAFKLGLSFLLKKMNGSQIRFLMLDEVDMPFSHAAVDAYAEIIRFFQKDFTIFVITHNDRLKAKFSNAILVEQDKNGVSRAKVVSSW